MKKHTYYLVDVFTGKPFGGNQLAVFPSGQDVPTELRQKIAREFNFSETTFVLPPDDASNDFRLQIFTPEKEIPMAGHPTIGSCFALLKKNHISADKQSIIVEEGIGNIQVDFSMPDGKLIITMRQPLPVWGDFFDKGLIAEILSLSKDDISEQYPVQVISCGIPFLYIPIKNLLSVKKIKLRLDLYEKYLSNFSTNNLFVFTTETENIHSTVHGRMFAPGIGVMEDPATGSANGPLGAYLYKYGLVEENIPIISEQGFEMGRPSTIHIDIHSENGAISHVYVGGESVFMGEGFLYTH